MQPLWKTFWRLKSYIYHLTQTYKILVFTQRNWKCMSIPRLLYMNFYSSFICKHRSGTAWMCIEKWMDSNVMQDLYNTLLFSNWKKWTGRGRRGRNKWKEGTNDIYYPVNKSLKKETELKNPYNPPIKWGSYCRIPFVWISRKFLLIWSDRVENRGCLVWLSGVGRRAESARVTCKLLRWWRSSSSLLKRFINYYYYFWKRRLDLWREETERWSIC